MSDEKLFEMAVQIMAQWAAQGRLNHTRNWEDVVLNDVVTLHKALSLAWMEVSLDDDGNPIAPDAGGTTH